LELIRIQKILKIFSRHHRRCSKGAERMQPPRQESLSSWLGSKSKHSSFYDSPGAMEHANYQLLPLTPTTGTPVQSEKTPDSANGRMHQGSLNKVLETAQKKRDQATAALDSVTKALQPRENDAPYVRFSPGHFVLPTTTSVLKSPAPSHLKTKTNQQLALGSPFSATPPRHNGARTGDIVENLAATLKSLGGGNTPAASITKKIAPPSFPMTTPLSSSSRLGKISSSAVNVSPGSQDMPSSVNFMNNATTTTMTTTTPPRTKTTTSLPLPTSAVSHKLLELQKHHSELLAACHEAESAATRAKNERNKALEELKNATTKLHCVQNSLEQGQQNLEKLATAEHAQQVQLDETTQKLAKYQAEASENLLELELAKKETSEMEIKLGLLKEEVKAVQSEALAVQTDTIEVQNLSLNRGELEEQVGKATACLESLLRRQSHAESAALQAENRFIAASTTLQELETLVQLKNEELVSTEALAVEAEALLEEKEARAAEAQGEWEAAEEKLGALDSGLVEVAARLEAKRHLVAETEQRCEVLEREMRCAEDYTKIAKTAAEKAEQELSRILISVDAARADESLALEEATEAESRAEVASELASAEEQRAEEAGAVVADLEKRWHQVEAAEERFVELQASIGEAENLLVTQKQLLIALDERDALLDELESAQEYSAVAAAEAQRAQQLGEDVEAKMQSALSQSEAIILELEVKLEASRLAEAEEREAKIEAETLAKNSLAEIERVTHSHFRINEAKLLEVELNEARQQLTRAANAAESAAQRATLAEKQVDCADNQLTLALVERDAALDRVEALCSARDIAAAEIAELKKDAAHREAAFDEMSHHQNQLESVLRTLKQERGEAQALAEALNLQVEALQDRLRAETGRRVMLEQMKTCSSSRGQGKKVANCAAPEVEKLVAQNATLKATATRLSKALAMALQRPSSGAGAGSENDTVESEDCIPAIYSPQNSHRQQQHPWNSKSSHSASLHKGPELSAVLQQLEAVENLLSSPH